MARKPKVAAVKAHKAKAPKADASNPLNAVAANPKVKKKRGTDLFNIDLASHDQPQPLQPILDKLLTLRNLHPKSQCPQT